MRNVGRCLTFVLLGVLESLVLLANLAQVSIAAATAVLGYDLLKDTIYSQSQRGRRLVAAALAGSAAALDTIVSIFVGNVKVATLYNKATGAPTRDHYVRVGAPVPAGSEVKVIVDDAPATNAINLDVDFEEE